MRIRIGYDLAFSGSMPTPTILMLSVHPSRLEDLSEPQRIVFDPAIPSHTYTDRFGNLCTRIVMPSGTLAVSSRNVVYDSGLPDTREPDARQIAIEKLPEDTLEFLLGSRYCETDRLSDTAWSLFGRMSPGWARVQAICDYVHDRLTFNYLAARSTRTAWEGNQECIGVCRDFAHLAIALCRCMNIPARYCTGYLGDIGVPAAPDPMDFSAWFESNARARTSGVIPE
jgi:transglutaminase-like putative cysteine protease